MENEMRLPRDLSEGFLANYNNTGLGDCRGDALIAHCIEVSFFHSPFSIIHFPFFPNEPSTKKTPRVFTTRGGDSFSYFGSLPALKTIIISLVRLKSLGWPTTSSRRIQTASFSSCESMWISAEPSTSQ